MNIVVTFAVASEFANWRRSGFQKTGPRVYRMRASYGEIYVVVTGIGMRGVDGELRRLLALPADFCIASGLAGALNAKYETGSVLVARGAKKEVNGRILTSDGGLVAAAVRCGAHPANLFFTSKAVVNAPEDRFVLGEFADAVDMETFYVLAEAHRAGVPAVALRAVSDSPENPLPIDFDRVTNSHGQIQWLRLLAQLAGRPAGWSRFAKFGIASSRAVGNLAEFLNEYVEFVAVNESLRVPIDAIATR
jgi:nucleoside phosphorylase